MFPLHLLCPCPCLRSAFWICAILKELCGKHCFGFLSLDLLHIRLVFTTWLPSTSILVFTWCCSAYWGIQNSISCVYQSAFSCSSLQSLCDLPDVKCRSHFPQFRWKSGDPLLGLIYLRSCPSPWWTWASLPYFIALVMGWDFASLPAVLWWGSWYLASDVLPPESSFLYLVPRWTTIPASSPAFPNLSRIFLNFIVVASEDTSVCCHWNREPNLLGTR